MSIADLYADAADAGSIAASENSQENDDSGLAALYQGHVGVDSEQEELACKNLGGEFLVLLQYVFNFWLESGAKVCTYCWSQDGKKLDFGGKKNK